MNQIVRNLFVQEINIFLDTVDLVDFFLIAGHQRIHRANQVGLCHLCHTLHLTDSLQNCSRRGHRMFRADVGKLELFVFLVISADDKVRCLHQKRGKRQHQEYLAYFDDRVCICDHTACFVSGNTHKEVNYLFSKQQENNGADNRSGDVEQQVDTCRTFCIRSWQESRTSYIRCCIQAS